MAMKRYSAFPKAPALLNYVTASHQTGLDTRSMTRRSIKVGIRRGEGRARALLDYEAACPPKCCLAEAGGIPAQVCLCWTVPEPAGVRHTIRLFNVLSRALVGGVLPLCRDAIGVFCSLRRRWGWLNLSYMIIYKHTRIYIYIYIYIYTQSYTHIWIQAERHSHKDRKRSRYVISLPQIPALS